MSKTHPPAVPQGFTLVELIVTLAIISISLAIGTPAFSNMVERHQATDDIRQLQTLIDTTRSYAVIQQVRTTLCPLDEHQVCQRNWNAPLTLFADHNGNRALDLDDVIVTTAQSAETNVLRTYPKKALVFDERGFADFNNGSFTYCKTLNNSSVQGAVWIISRMGRVRGGQDKNGDGVPETANGGAITCLPADR
jgi:type IV fimbrial biogenesis protein FimT